MNTAISVKRGIKPIVVRRFPPNHLFEAIANKAGLTIFEVMKISTIPKMFSSLGVNLDRAVVTNEQREDFVTRCNFKEDSPTFVFLHKTDDFVAVREQFIGGKMFANQSNFSLPSAQDGCYAGHSSGTWCLVVPLSVFPK